MEHLDYDSCALPGPMSASLASHEHLRGLTIFIGDDMPWIARGSKSCTLWWTNIAMENHHFNGKIHYKWPFSIARLVHQRVPQFSDQSWQMDVHPTESRWMDPIIPIGSHSITVWLGTTHPCTMNTGCLGPKSEKIEVVTPMLTESLKVQPSMKKLWHLFQHQIHTASNTRISRSPRI